MIVAELISRIKQAPQTVEFNDVISTIEAHFNYQPTRFSNGLDEHKVINEAGSNEGSCKIFAFAQLNDLNQDETLACFGNYYRNDTMEHPEGNDHMNIRQFMKHGWSGIQFDGEALKEK
jgi:hypothetical protein